MVDGAHATATVAKGASRRPTSCACRWGESKHASSWAVRGGAADSTKADAGVTAAAETQSLMGANHRSARCGRTRIRKGPRHENRWRRQGASPLRFTRVPLLALCEIVGGGRPLRLIGPRDPSLPKDRCPVVRKLRHELDRRVASNQPVVLAISSPQAVNRLVELAQHQLRTSRKGALATMGNHRIDKVLHVLGDCGDRVEVSFRNRRIEVVADLARERFRPL